MSDTQKLGRDRSEIKVTKMVMGVIGRTHEEAEGAAAQFVANHGWSAHMIDLMRARMTLGDADSFGEQIAKVIDAGIDGVTLNLVANAHDPELVALAGRTADAAIPKA